MICYECLLGLVRRGFEESYAEGVGAFLVVAWAKSDVDSYLAIDMATSELCLVE
jgi:hypothetical protein